MKVTIIGAGNMGRGIGTRALAGGNEVELVDRNREDAQDLADQLGPGAAAAGAVSGEIVVLALPYEQVARAVKEHSESLVGRVVVDIANPLDWESGDRVVTPERSSSAEETARLVPANARVVKAFNTTFAKTLVSSFSGVHHVRALRA